MKCGYRMLLSYIDNIINFKLKEQNKSINTILTKKETLKNNKKEKGKKDIRTGLRNIFSYPPKKYKLKFFENNNIFKVNENNNKHVSRKKHKSKKKEKLSQNLDNDNNNMKIKKKNKNSRENKISKTTKNNNISSSLRKIIYTKLNFYNYY